MKIHVEYFGPAHDWAGARSDTFDLEDRAALAKLIERMMHARPELAKRRTVLRFAVNESFVDQERELADQDRVAVIPPVSGGSDEDLVMIVDTPIDAAAVRDHVVGKAGTHGFEVLGIGGVVIFEGVTRLEEHPEFGPLLRLEYEAHGNMALQQMKKLAAAARRQWEVQRLALVHRVGPVPIGESSVVIGISCSHRGEAFDACGYLIDTLKQDVPIWKKEIWADGDPTWVDPSAESGPR